MRPELAHRTVPGEAGAGTPARILIVDDHDVSRAAVGALLRTEGFEVADVRTNDDPVLVAAVFRPAVAVVDVTPGRVAGFVVARQLGGLPHPPAVILTSSAGQRSFGCRLRGHQFVAKADLRGETIRPAIGRHL